MIRPVRASDLSDLADLAERSFRDAFGSFFTAQQIDNEVAKGRSKAYFQTAMKHETILVDAEGDRMVGYVQFGTPHSPGVTPEPGDQELHRLFVDTSVQGQGVGRRLMEAALAHPLLAAAPHIYIRVYENNPRAIKLYQKFGFKKVGTTPGLVDPSGDDFILMRPAKVEADT